MYKVNAFLKYFYQDMGLVLDAFCSIFISFFSFFNTLFNYPMRMKILESYTADFGALDWVLTVLVNILLVLLLGLIIYFAVKVIRRVLRGKVSVQENDKLRAEVAKLTRDVFKLNYEKDKILAMKVSEMGMTPDENFITPGEEEEQGEGEEGEDSEYRKGNRNTFDSPAVNPDESRFFRLTSVDNYYKLEYQKPVYDNDITLEEICVRYRSFAASRLRLFYNIDILRYFIAALGTARLVILQGISGTGKTSLPYSFGKFLQLDTTVAAVQPAWRERTELFGYFNEFTKMFNETEFLRAVYEANFFEDPHVIILDEMNIARVEYYFAEMLSVLEMPRPEEWLVDIVTTTWDNDPCLIDGGKIHVNSNTWFVGTINNDDSTFAVADKVYDRAITIDLDSKAESFVPEDADPVHITAKHLDEMFAQAKVDYPISKEMFKKIDDLDIYIIKHFRVAFGNRIMKQIREFVPCYIACGGTEIDGIDFIIDKKILRKFEALNMGFIKDELHRLVIYLDKNFGKTNMKICKEHIARMQKMS